MHLNRAVFIVNMVKLIREDKVLPIVSNYLNILKNTGYVSPEITRKMLVYLFIMNFVNTVYYFLDEKEYAIIGRALVKLFTDGGCLFPYATFDENRQKLKFTLGKATYMGIARIKSTNNTKLRISESGTLKTV